MVASDGSGLRRLTRNPRETKHRPSWSPDGRRIVYSTDYGNVDVIDPAGRHHKRLAEDAAVEGATAWSPDGRTVVFAAARGSLGLLTVDSGRVRMLPARGIAEDLAWSPDGRRIAYASGGSIYIATVAGGRTRRLT